MKIALAQLNYCVGDLPGNTQKIITYIQKAKAEKADLVVFSELAVCGYPPHDLLEHEDFINGCVKSIEEITKSTTGIAAIVGCPSVNTANKGKHLFNSAFFLVDGKVESIVHKGLLPTYDVFDEYRYFEPCRTFHTIEYLGTRIALTICEDLWSVSYHPLYFDRPMDHLERLHPQLMINIAASPFAYTHEEERRHVLGRNTLKYKLPIVYVNQVGAHTDLIFDGGSLAMDAHGHILHEMPLFEESFSTINSKILYSSATALLDPAERRQEMLIYEALKLGIRDYFSKLGFQKTVIGLSGGIDSAVVTALAAEALGPENVFCILMPSEFSSDHSVSDSVDMCKQLGIAYETIPISPIYDSFQQQLKPVFKDLPFNVAEENIQSRIRGALLMAYSNKFGHILLNTSNKSELAVGYGTLYGDMNGGLSILGDVYKTQVYLLAHYINRREEKIPMNIITKEPSAELRPGQKDSDSLPIYDVLDRILYAYIEECRHWKEISIKGFDKHYVKKVIDMVNRNEHKRFQAPPVLRVSVKSFGAGRRMPIVAKY